VNNGNCSRTRSTCVVAAPLSLSRYLRVSARNLARCSFGGCASCNAHHSSDGSTHSQYRDL